MDLPPSLARVFPGEFTVTPPLISLLTANLVTIALAVLENWDLATVFFIYWVQSVIIGVFTVVTLLSADPADLGPDAEMAKVTTPDGKTVASIPSRIILFALAGFFAVHYGLFHFVYFSFIVEGGIFGPVNFGAPGIPLSCGLFFANHLYSYFYHRDGTRKDGEFITRTFTEPYNRIIPMHLTIIFGSMIVLVLEVLGITTTMPVLVFFLLLKTYLDVKMHIRKHYEDAHPDEPKMYVGF